MKNVQVVPTVDHDCGTHSLKKGVESTMALVHAQPLEAEGILVIKGWERPVSPQEQLENRVKTVESELETLKESTAGGDAEPEKTTTKKSTAKS